jgi:CRP/FNR family transcriptional regulator, cyclic AMP receptor protein
MSVPLAPLDHVGWLAEQPKDFRDWVAKVARWRHFDVGQFVYLAGDEPDGLYGVASGGVEITFPLVVSEPIVIYHAQVGFWIGESADLSEAPRLVSLMASTECRILHVPRPAIQRLLSDTPQYWKSFYALSHLNSALMLNLLAEALSLSVRARACRRLLQLTSNETEVELTQDHLAKMLGLARSTVRSQLADLAAHGAIEMGYGRMRVLSRDVLERYQNEQ